MSAQVAYMLAVGPPVASYALYLYVRMRGRS